MHVYSTAARHNLNGVAHITDAAGMTEQTGMLPVPNLVCEPSSTQPAAAFLHNRVCVWLCVRYTCACDNVCDRASNTAHRSAFRPFRLTMQADGNLVGESTEGVQHDELVRSAQVVAAGHRTEPGGGLCACVCGRPVGCCGMGTYTISHHCSQQYCVCLHFNVILAATDKLRQAVWMTSTGGEGAAPYRLVVQGDGNAVIFDASSTAMWATHTAETPN